MTEIKHTPTPWDWGYQKGQNNVLIVHHKGDGFSEVIAYGMGNDNDEQNAAFIVRACDAHDDNLNRFARIRQIAEANGYDEIAQICTEAFQQDQSVGEYAKAKVQS